MTNTTDTTGTTDTSVEAKRNAMMIKIRFLFDKAESTDHEAERDAYMAKAQALLTKYAIDFDDLRSNNHDADVIVTKRVWLAAPYSQNKISLLAAIATSNDCKVVSSHETNWVPEDCLLAPKINSLGQSDQKGRPGYITGWSRDIEAVVMIYTTLTIQMDREFFNNPKPSWENGRAWRNSFMQGFISGVRPRLTKSRQDAVNEAVAEQGDDLLPVLRNRKAQVEDAYEQKWRGQLRSSSRRGSSGSGWGAGHSAGSRASVGNRSVSSGGGRALNA